MISEYALKRTSQYLLVVQTVGVIFSQRYSKVNGIALYNQIPLTAVAVLFAEMLKMFGSLLLIFFNKHCDISQTRSQLKSELFGHLDELLKVTVSACLYALQNMLLYVALGNLNPAVYQAFYQGKIITTAIFSILLLKRTYTGVQWFSFFEMIAGIILIQLASQKSPNILEHDSFLVGSIAVFSACVLSGLAGVYLEKVLKTSTTSLWVKNIQLAAYGIISCLCVCLTKDWQAIAKDGMLQGFNLWTWSAIVFSGLGGLLIAVILKYFDNITKCYLNSISIVITNLISFCFLPDSPSHGLFWLGLILVLTAIILYMTNPDLKTLKRKSLNVLSKDYELIPVHTSA